MLRAGRSTPCRGLVSASARPSLVARFLSMVLLLLILALLAACGKSSPAASPSGGSPGSAGQATAAPSDAVAEVGSDAPEDPAENSVEAPPASQLATMRWSEDDAGAPWSVTGGDAAAEGGRYCLTASGTEPVIVAVPSTASTLASGAGVSVLSVQVLASTADVAGASVGLAASGVLLELDDQARWRQTPVGPDLVPGSPGEWIADAGLVTGSQHVLGILCEAGTLYLVGDDTILAQVDATLDLTAPLALVTTVPGGGGGACFGEMRVEVWPEASGGDDRLAILAEMGTPDAFSIAFEQDPAGHSYRIETWSYAVTGMTLTFADGVLIETGGIDASSEDISAWPVDYDPLSFSAWMTLEAVQGLLEGQELVSLEVPEEFGASTVLYAGDQIVLGFSEGELEFVETLPITVDTEGGES